MRKSFLAVVLDVVFVLAAQSFLAAPAAHADGPGRRVVHGTGSSLDVAAVQAAVDAGGRVVLVGDFDFGLDGQVVIRNDVHVSGRGTTVIRGGTVTFVSPLPTLAAGATLAPGPAIAVENLTFDGARGTPIRIAYARALDIRQVTVRNVVPLPAPTIPTPTLSYFQVGISVSTQAYAPAIVPGALTGKVRIEHNDLDMTGPAPGATVCTGIQLFRGWGVDAEIRHNTVSSCARNGIEALDNSLDASGGGHVAVTHNRIRSAVVGSPWPVPFRPNGIVAGWFFFPLGALDPTRNPPHEIAENAIEVSGGPLAGIFVNANGAVVEENGITVGGSGAMGITLASANGLVKENVVSGSGVYGIRVAPFFPNAPTVVADGNTLLCNGLAGFVAARADVGVAGNLNTIVGTWSTSLDSGVGNQWIPSAACERDGD